MKNKQHDVFYGTGINAIAFFIYSANDAASVFQDIDIVLKEAPSNPLALHVKESNSYFNAETFKKQIKEQHTIYTILT